MRDTDGRFIKGTIPWNKGKETNIIPKNSFKKGFIPWNKGMKGKIKWSIEQKNRLSEKLKGRKVSEETRNKIRESQIGRKRPHTERDKNPNWKGGKILHAHGYILIKKPDHPYCENRGYVREHRLICESYIGSYLRKEWDVHHINENKIDNRIENLMVFSSRSAHIRFENGKYIHPYEIIFDGRKLLN